MCNLYAVSKTDWNQVAWKAGQRSEKDADADIPDQERGMALLSDGIGAGSLDGGGLEVPLLGTSPSRAHSSKVSPTRGALFNGGDSDEEDRFDSD